MGVSLIKSVDFVKYSSALKMSRVSGEAGEAAVFTELVKQQSQYLKGQVYITFESTHSSVDFFRAELF